MPVLEAIACTLKRFPVTPLPFRPSPLPGDPAARTRKKILNHTKGFNMKQIQTFQIFPAIPNALAFLGVLSRNMWWSWQQDAIELFRRIDPRLWEASGRNPIRFATLLPQQRLEELALDDSFLAHLKRVEELFVSQVQAPAEKNGRAYPAEDPIAYFSMEYGIHESLPLFAGGLGVLAGDHLKASSALALPLVGVGMLYRQGYFRQFLNQDGWQQEENPETDLYQIPLARAKDPAGQKVRVSIDGPSGDIFVEVWQIMIGRIPLYLLDTNLVQNTPEHREITTRLYAGDPIRRLAQEVVLGIGGMKALATLGIHPTVCHMNEGHCSFANIERLAQIMERHALDVPTAMELIPRATVFTTHTPVAAGHDEFRPELVRPYLRPIEQRLGMAEDEMLRWGQPEGAGADAPFSMFVLGLRMAQYCNGVSKLHGEVARKMWSHVWPQQYDEDVPITHVTNGIHVPSFLSPDLVRLFERYLSPGWDRGSSKSENLQHIDEIYDEELWRAHEMSRSRLVRTVRKYLARQYARRNAPETMMNTAENALNPDTLTIGFARRFTAYKRAYLAFMDPERLEAILSSKTRPVQFVFAGKAHPKDNEGKETIKNLIHFINKTGLHHKIVFLEDYDMYLARRLVQGVDVWLNTPRRPFEACGTSGMKAAVNGILNLSILDGWWDEGYRPERGWRIGNGEEYSDTAYQDAVESQALYNVLENLVIPCFYDRPDADIPLRWIKKMKASIKMAMENYCSFRMVAEYEERFYQPAAQRFHELMADNASEARHLNRQHHRLRQLWKQIRIESPVRQKEGPFRVNDTFTVQARVHLGELKPEEASVEVYFGLVQSMDSIAPGSVEPMSVVEDLGAGSYLYGCTLTCRNSGRYGFTVRVVPQADTWIRNTPGLITWA